MPDWIEQALEKLAVIATEVEEVISMINVSDRLDSIIGQLPTVSGGNHIATTIHRVQLAREAIEVASSNLCGVQLDLAVLEEKLREL